MKKTLLVVMALCFLTFAGMAQLGSKKISVAAEAALPTGDMKDFSKVGIGGTVKMLYGITRSGQLTFTGGYVSLSAKEMYKEILGATKINQSIIPLLAGYRQNFGGFYVEPQVGYGIYAAKIKGGIANGSDSNGALTWAAGVGYVIKNIEIGARYQSGHKDGESNALIAFRLGYNFSL